MEHSSENDALDDARLCLVLSTALLAVACGAIFALSAGDESQPGWGSLVLPGLLPLHYLFQKLGLGNGNLSEFVSFVLITVVSFACYFLGSFAIIRTCRHFSRQHREHKI